MKVLKTSLLVLVSVACTSNGGGGTSASPKYIPSISEPAFEKIGDLESKTSYEMYSKCDDKIMIDPRLKQNHVFTQVFEGMSQKSGEPFRNVEERTMLNTNENSLNYLYKSENGPVRLRGEFSQSCEDKEGKKVCGLSTMRIVESSEKVTAIPTHYRNYQATCDSTWSGHYGEGAVHETTVELGTVALPNGEKVMALRIHSVNDEKDGCEKPRFAKSVSTQIVTFALPSTHAGFGHCFQQVYTESTFTDKVTGVMIKADRSALLGSPKPSELSYYPGFENLPALFPTVKKEEKKEVAQK